nr:RNA-directed DNA polymerase, eukaryota [Tanacetum cinerariifolium]
MGSYRSREDDYGHVVDSFIPLKRSKVGKRFGFVRFINAFNVERLVNNLCTIWVDRFKLHANIARFNKTYRNGYSEANKKENEVPKSSSNGPCKVNGTTDSSKSFVHVVKGINLVEETESILAIVLDDEYLNSKDLSNSLMGRVKEFASLPNPKKILCNEGFDNLCIRYMGELWVLLESESIKAKELFQDNVGAGLWFSVLRQASNEFTTEGRIVWVEVKGIPFKFWSGATFKKIVVKWRDLLDVDDHARAKEVPGWIPDCLEDEEDDEDQSQQSNNDGIFNDHDINNGGEDSKVEEVYETVFDVSDGPKEKQSEDPFGLYPLLNKDKKKRHKRQRAMTKVLNILPDSLLRWNRMRLGDGISNKFSESLCSGRFKEFEVPRTGGSMLSVMEEILKVGQAMGYNMKGCVNNITEIIESQGASGGLQETKMETIDLLSVRLCWGNLNFDYVHTDSIGANLLIVVVYAPHDARDKRMLWDYLTHVTNQWDGEVEMMGDFNEVSYRSDRFGLIFNVHGADVFNSFITNAGLEEVRLGGSAAITLDRYLLDHRPILLRETLYDYGLISFRFYHYWLKADGFDKFVMDSGNEVPEDDNNAIHKFLYKLKFLKSNIRRWYNVYRNYKKGAVVKLKEDLRFLDEEIDKGNGSVEIVNKRLEVLNKLQHVVNAQASEVAQKAKIKWYVEGDENVKFFHGMLNKKRSQLNIRGVMKNGTWTDNPDTVKQEFFHHFKNRFEKPSNQRVRIDMSFLNVLSIDQREDLERMVSKEEVKKAVFDCGMDKSPGPDGFTFGLYRHFWSTIECDVFEVVKHFFTHGDIPNGCNSIFIALIPKISNANMVKDFRSISLNGSIYKIIAKILTNRLLDVLGDIVNEVQSAFIKERQILDGPFILNELMQWCRMKKNKLLFSKSTLKKLMTRFDGIFWMMFYINSVLAINGLCGFKVVSNHLEAPFLSMKVIRGNFSSLKRVVDLGLFTGISLNFMVNLFHLFFADDAMFLGQWSESNIDTLVHVLDCYHRASGLRINMCPFECASKIESIRSHFFNGHDIRSKKSSWVKWNKVLTAKEKGGLGVSSLYAPNRGLMFKWEVKQMQNQGVNFFEYIWIKLGNGYDTLFWEDKWCEGGVLKDLFSRLYALELMRKSTVSVKLSESSLENSFRRKVRSGVEEAQLGDLYELISTVTLSPSVDRYAKLKSVFEGIFYGLWWSIWDFRNKLLFEKEAPSQAAIFDNIVSISFNWWYSCVSAAGTL